MKGEKRPVKTERRPWDSLVKAREKRSRPFNSALIHPLKKRAIQTYPSRNHSQASPSGPAGPGPERPDSQMHVRVNCIIEF